jgi:hypothetical protein
VFELANLRDGDATGFGLGAEDEKIGVPFQIGIQKIGG